MCWCCPKNNFLTEVGAKEELSDEAEKEELLHEGTAYIAHVIPEVVPVALNTKERKY